MKTVDQLWAWFSQDDPKSLCTSAWQGMLWDEIPDHVREQFGQLLEKAIELEDHCRHCGRYIGNGYCVCWNDD